MPLKILLVHADKHPWATQRRAEALKREWKDDEVDIVDRWNLPDGEPYDVIHFLFSGGLSKCKDYILKHKEKVFTTLASQRTLNGMWDKLEDLKEIYTETVCCVCQNPKLERRLQVLTEKSNTIFIPNGVDTDLFKREFVVGYVGAGDSAEHKGVDIIREACGELGLTLKTANNQYEEMPEFYREIDCLVLMSESEGCNNPTLEALAMNKPVISTYTGITHDLEGITVVVERNTKSLKEALRKKAGRIQILEKYTWQKIASSYRDIYVKYENVRNSNIQR